MAPVRCGWCGTDPLYAAYHDDEWGVPVRDGRALFEKLLLDGFQAGLSWLTILRRRDALRAAFAGFDPVRLARFDAADCARLMADPTIIRHRQKVAAAIGNARAYLRLVDAGEDVAAALWGFVGGSVQQPHRRAAADVPTTSAESRAMAAWLRGHGFAFVGPTICYAFMQAVGMVNDHVVACHRHAPLAAAGSP